MTKEEIKSSLSTNYRGFVDFINTLGKEDYEQSKNRKWTPDQQMEHVYLGISPLERILQSLEVLFQANFGKSDGSSKDYNGIVKDYLILLEAGAKSTARFEP